MSARENLARYIGYEPGEKDPQFEALLTAACAEAISAVTPNVLQAGRAGALAEVLAAIEDPARRSTAAAHFNMGSGLGWESAHNIVRLMINPDIPQVACPDCRHRICDGDGPCGAILNLSAISDTRRCRCTTGSNPAYASTRGEPGDGA